jgi:micrococcal nuclease
VYEYAARLVKVVDADTLDLDIDVGFNIHTRQRVRLAGLNAPEKNTPQGQDAIAYVHAWLNDLGPDLTVRTVLDKREKYGRLLGTVIAKTRNLNADLITNGHALDYDGGRRALPGRGEPPAPAPVP